MEYIMLQHTWEILSVNFCASSGVPTFERKFVLVEGAEFIAFGSWDIPFLYRMYGSPCV